jgi:hypothetical protein
VEQPTNGQILDLLKKVVERSVETDNQLLRLIEMMTDRIGTLQVRIAELEAKNRTVH